MLKQLYDPRPLSAMTLRETLHTLYVLGMVVGLGIGVAGTSLALLIVAREPTTIGTVATLIMGCAVGGYGSLALRRVQKVKADLFARTHADKLRR